MFNWQDAPANHPDIVASGQNIGSLHDPTMYPEPEFDNQRINTWRADRINFPSTNDVAASSPMPPDDVARADDCDFDVESTLAKWLPLSNDLWGAIEKSAGDPLTDSLSGAEQVSLAVQASPDPFSSFESPPSLQSSEVDSSPNGSLQLQATTTGGSLASPEEPLRSRSGPLLDCPKCQKPFKRTCDYKYVLSAPSEPSCQTSQC